MATNYLYAFSSRFINNTVICDFVAGGALAVNALTSVDSEFSGNSVASTREGIFAVNAAWGGAVTGVFTLTLANPDKFVVGDFAKCGLLQNKFIINSTRFDNNHAGSVGGAIALPVSGCCDDVHIHASVFEHNSALAGSALYLATTTKAAVTESRFTDHSGLFATISCDQADTLNISACIFSNNYANFGSAVSVSHVDVLTFAGNTMTNHTGYSSTVRVADVTYCLMYDCVFVSNTASDRGGALELFGFTSLSKVELYNCTFVNNSASLGGAVYVQAPFSDVNCENVTFEGNNADFGALYLDACNSFSLKSSRFFGNSATTDGGGVYCRSISNDVSFENITFERNSASGCGGAATITHGFVTFQYVTIANNTAMYGAGVCLEGSVFERDLPFAYVSFNDSVIQNNTALSGCGGMYITRVVSDLTNVSIQNNTALQENGGGICCYDACVLDIQATAIDSNFAGVAGAGIAVEFLASLTLQHCRVSS
jgi:predicted outer membrane repeat protein